MQTIYEIGQTINNQQGSYHIKINYSLIIFDKNLLKKCYFEIVIYALSCNSQYHTSTTNTTTTTTPANTTMNTKCRDRAAAGQQ